MATVSASSALRLIWNHSPHRTQFQCFTLPIGRTLHFLAHGVVCNSSKHLTLMTSNIKSRESSCCRGVRKLKAVEEDSLATDQAVAEESVVTDEAVETRAEQPQEQPTVSVPVSPSDSLTMYFQAEGMMSEEAIPKLTKVLEDSEGVKDLQVNLADGLASVEFTKQTTVQATGVASGLVELVQGSGFKLQTLNLSFRDDDDLVV